MKKSKHEQNEPVVIIIIGRIVVKMWSQNYVTHRDLILKFYGYAYSKLSMNITCTLKRSSSTSPVLWMKGFHDQHLSKL